MENKTFYIVDSNILPPVFKGVILAKKLLADSTAANVSKAVKMVGISRSAFYKYKDYVFEYNDNRDNTATLNAVLSDKAGVFSAMASLLYELGANIVTVNQTTPVDGTAKVSLNVRTDNIKITLEELLAKLKTVKGIISVKAE